MTLMFFTNKAYFGPFFRKHHATFDVFGTSSQNVNRNAESGSDESWGPPATAPLREDISGRQQIPLSPPIFITIGLSPNKRRENTHNQILEVPNHKTLTQTEPSPAMSITTGPTLNLITNLSLKILMMILILVPRILRTTLMMTWNLPNSLMAMLRLTISFQDSVEPVLKEDTRESNSKQIRQYVR